MFIRLANALGTTVDYLLTGNPVKEMPLSNARLFRRFQALENFDPEDQKVAIKLIDAMIAKHKMQTALTSLDDQAINA